MFDLKNAKNRNGKMCAAVTVDVVSKELKLGDIGSDPVHVTCDACGKLIEKGRIHALDEQYLCPACFEATSHPG